MTKDMLIGEVIGIHGIRGELKVKPLTDDPMRFYDLKGIFLNSKGRSEYFEIDAVRLHKEAVLLQLREVKDRNTAEKYRGAEVRIERENAVDLVEDEYFISDLIGLQVTDGQKGDIGKISDILTTTGSVDTVEIQNSGKRIYVPFRKVYFHGVDLKAGTVTADIPEDFFSL